MFKKVLLGILLVGLLVPAVGAATNTVKPVYITAPSVSSVDTVILASTANYPDALVAGSAAAKIGAPVLLTDKGALTDQTRAVLDRLQPTNIIVVGGNAVVSTDVEQSLTNSGYNVTRLWGATRYGTAVQVAEHFWVEGADHAVLVQNSLSDRQGRVLAAAKELARDEQNPVYLTPTDSVPAAVLSSLQNLNVTSVTVVGTNVSAAYQQSLTDIGVTDVQTVTGASGDDVAKHVRDRWENNVNQSTKMLVVASHSYHESIAAANLPAYHVVHVSGENDTADVVSLINTRDVTHVKVVGDPKIAGAVSTALQDQTNATVTVPGAHAMSAVGLNANLTEENEHRFAEVNKNRVKQWEQEREHHSAHVKAMANKTLTKADDLVDVNASTEAQTHLKKAQLLYSDGKYFEAAANARDAINAVQQAHLSDHKDHEDAVRQAMQDEMGSIQTHIEDLQQVNHQFAAEMQHNMSVDERLKVIQEFQHEHRDAVKKMVEEAQNQHTTHHEDWTKRLEDARKTLREHRESESSHQFRFKTACTDQSAEGVTVVKNAVSGHESAVRATGTLLMPTPNYAGSASYTTTDHVVNMSITVNDTHGFGIQCVGKATYRYDVDVSPGNWTVNLFMTADGKSIYTETNTVTVTADDTADRKTSGDSEHENTSMRVHTESQGETGGTRLSANTSVNAD